ncbi:MAG: hypothetical protein ACRDQ4_23535 [Pseudonocardiaceae bacterium]
MLDFENLVLGGVGSLPGRAEPVLAKALDVIVPCLRQRLYPPRLRRLG